VQAAGRSLRSRAGGDGAAWPCIQTPSQAKIRADEGHFECLVTFHTLHAIGADSFSMQSGAFA